MFRLHLGEQDLTAELPLSLQKGDLVPALGRDFRDFEPSWPPSDDDHAPRRLSFADEALVYPQFSPGAGVLNAADALLLADLMNAAVVAGDTRTDQVGTAPQKLVGRLWVGDQLARPTDEIGFAGFQDGFRALRRANAAERDHRQLGVLL